MCCSECHEVCMNCETLCAVESPSEGFQYSEAELKLLTDKWSRYSVGYFFFGFCVLVLVQYIVVNTSTIDC